MSFSMGTRYESQLKSLGLRKTPIPSKSEILPSFWKSELSNRRIVEVKILFQKCHPHFLALDMRLNSNHWVWERHHTHYLETIGKSTIMNLPYLTKRKRRRRKRFSTRCTFSLSLSLTLQSITQTPFLCVNTVQYAIVSLHHLKKALSIRLWNSSNCLDTRSGAMKRESITTPFLCLKFV